MTAMPGTECAARALIAMFLWVTQRDSAMSDPTSAWHTASLAAWDRALGDAMRPLSSNGARALGEALQHAATAVQQAARSDRVEAQRLRAENAALRTQLRDASDQLDCARAVALYLDEQNRLMATEAMMAVRERLRLLQKRMPSTDTDAVDDDCCCVVCTEILVLPVTNRCGHTLCAPCYSLLMHAKGFARSCPMCRGPLHVTDVAIQLRNLVESRYPGQVARRLDAFMTPRDGAAAKPGDQSAGASDNLC